MKIPFLFSPKAFNTLFEEDAALATGGGGGEVSAGILANEALGSSSAPPETAPTNTGDQSIAPPSPDNAGLAAQPSLDDILSSIPETDDDVTEQINREAVLSQRGHLRVLGSAIKELKPLEGFKDLTQRGTPEIIKSRLDAFDQLFSPAVDPETKQPMLDERTGAPKYTTTPFWESMRTKQAGFVDQATHDLLYLPQVGPDGQPVINQKTGQPETILRDVFRQLGLDPDRYDDYKNLDTILAQSGNALTADDLAAIPENLREAFKSYPESIRQQLWGMDDEARNFHLTERQEKLDRQKQEAEQAKEQEQIQAQTQARQMEQTRQMVVTEQNKYLAEERQSALSEILNALDQQVTFSGDEKTNSIFRGMIGSLVAGLLDEDFDFATGPVLKAMGVELNGFRDALNTATTQSKNYKLYELAGQGTLAENAKSAAYGPKQQAVTKAGQIALDLARALGAQVQAKSEQRDKLLAQAGGSRVPPEGSVNTGSQSILPPGVRADSPEANAIAWQRAQAGRAQTS